MASLWRSLRSLAVSPLAPLLRHGGGSSAFLAGHGTCAPPPRFLSACARLGAVVPASRQGSNLLSTPASSSLLQPASVSILVPQRTYKVKSALKLRCSGCFFVRRQGRLFVECKLKPRHKQMQVMAARKLFRNDYSKGDVALALHWKYRTERFYKLGKNEFSRFNWLEGKLGHTV